MQNNAPDPNQFSPAASIAGVRERLAYFGIAPNKALGQNFLIDAALRDDMLFHMPVQDAHVVEIGPGLGALTEGLLSRAHTILAVEKDADMVRALNIALMHKPEAKHKLTILHADILTLPLSHMHPANESTPLYICGNLPYYITTPITMRFLAATLPIYGMAFMVQEEAAARFFAPPGDRVYGPLAVAAQCMYHVKKGIALSPAAYYPAPSVRSRIVYLERREGAAYPAFVRFLEGVFSMRRKTLFNNLLHMGMCKEDALHALDVCKIAPAQRAEALAPEALLQLHLCVRDMRL